MPLRVAVQMDPLDHINISGDSTFALMLKAQELGHRLFHYLAEDLTYNDGRLYAGAREVSVQAVAGDHFQLGDFAILDLGKDVDVVNKKTSNILDLVQLPTLQFSEDLIRAGHDCAKFLVKRGPGIGRYRAGNRVAMCQQDR